MAYRVRKRQRRSIRLPGYDYSSPGAYFVTVCVHGGECLLGEVVDEEMGLNEFGQIAHDFWMQVPVHFPNVSIDTFVIMPNHWHAIFVIQEPMGEGTSPLPGVKGGGDACRGAVAAPTVQSRIGKPTLGQIVAYYKHQTTKHINQLRDMLGVPFWQRNYWEHVVRDEASLDRIREYIENNPARWEEDQLHPAAPPNAFNQWRS